MGNLHGIEGGSGGEAVKEGIPEIFPVQIPAYDHDPIGSLCTGLPGLPNVHIVQLVYCLEDVLAVAARHVHQALHAEHVLLGSSPLPQEVPQPVLQPASAAHN